MTVAKAHPNLIVSCVSPGFIASDMAKHFGAKLTPDQGTVSTMHCLFAELTASGQYYGSDGLRSPINVGREPGEPEYKGE